MLFFKMLYPAKGNIASLGIGGKIVSSNAATKTPGYTLSETKDTTNSMNDSISFNCFLPSGNNEVQYSILYNNLRNRYDHNRTL